TSGGCVEEDVWRTESESRGQKNAGGQPGESWLGLRPALPRSRLHTHSCRSSAGPERWALNLTGGGYADSCLARFAETYRIEFVLGFVLPAQQLRMVQQGVQILARFSGQLCTVAM